MKTKRFLATIPKELAEKLDLFAQKQESSVSLVVQHAVTKCSVSKPTEEDVEYIRGETQRVQLSFSQTAYQLIELWSQQTNLTKSKLITYSLQKTLTKGEED